LLRRGHEVVALTRTEDKAQRLRSVGATPVLGDALDTDRLRQLVIAARPDVVMDQMTGLPQRVDPFHIDHFYERFIQLRSTASPALFAAAQEVEAQRFLFQSVAFMYAPDNGRLRSEDDRVFEGAPKPWDLLPLLVALERQVVESRTSCGVVLRYGFFYGPGTHYAASDGALATLVRRRRYPIIGSGAGVYSFIHVRDAAEAALVAAERAEAGIYNIVDDRPVPLREWLPYYAQRINARPPRRVPAFLARPLVGPLLVHWSTRMPGASNEKAGQQLGWRPRLGSWREGFATHLG
jgi:nucleoside-diphosphate-sugar epimerase